MTTFIKNHKLIFISVTIILLLIFLYLMGNHATAEAGNLNDMKGYESILIKDGDTLSSIATCYAKEYSHYSDHEYMDAIVSLNSLTSEHIQSGVYILLPKYR